MLDAQIVATPPTSSRTRSTSVREIPPNSGLVKRRLDWRGAVAKSTTRSTCGLIPAHVARVIAAGRNSRKEGVSGGCIGRLDQHRGWFNPRCCSRSRQRRRRSRLLTTAMGCRPREDFQEQQGYEKPQTPKLLKNTARTSCGCGRIAGYRSDIVVSEEASTSGETYRGIRNALRYQLSTSTISIRRKPCRRPAHRPRPLDSRRICEAGSRSPRASTNTNSTSSIKN